jgi:hypothetical protein
MKGDPRVMEQLIKEQQESGETIAQFCLSRGINDKQFYRWRQRIGKKPEATFALVTSGRRVELELRSGISIRVAVEDLKAVLEALG